jgi:hypothetical protein
VVVEEPFSGRVPEQDSDAAPLDVELAHWISRAVPRWTDARQIALMRRVGWLGSACPTLEELGQDTGITRERVRQLQRTLVQKLRRVGARNTEALRRTAQLVSDNRHDAHEPAGRLLEGHGLSGMILPDRGIELLFDLMGLPHVFEEYQATLARKLPEHKRVLGAAKDLTRSVGVVSIDWVCEEAEPPMDPAAIRHALEDAPWARFLDRDWFWDPSTPPGRNRLVNLTLKMLAACGPLQLQELRNGLDRHYRWGRLPHNPPPHALRLFYRENPAFTLSEDDVVASVAILDPEHELDTTELTFYHLLQGAPDGILDRGELFELAVAAGMNPNTFSVYTSYSPILDNPVQDRWILRGSDVSPPALEARRRERRHRLATDEWTPRGTLLVQRELGDAWSLVVGIGRALSPYFANRTFAAVSETGASAAAIRFDQKGLSWGYSPFLQAAGACRGDVLVADFNLADSTVILTLRRLGRANNEDPGGYQPQVRNGH